MKILLIVWDTLFLYMFKQKFVDPISIREKLI